MIHCSKKLTLCESLKDSIRQDPKAKDNRKIKIAFLKRLFPYIKPYWKKALIGSIYMIVLSLLALPSPYLMKFVFDNVLTDRNIELLNLIVVLLIGIQFTRVILSTLTDYHFNLFGQEIMVKLKKDLFFRILRLPLSFFDKNQTGYILSRIGEVEGLSFFFSSTLAKMLISLFEFVFCLSILFYLNWGLTIVSLFVLPLFFFSTKFFARGIRRVARETIEKGAIISRQIQDSLLGVDVIKYFGAESREVNRIHGSLEEFKNSYIKRNIVFTFSSEMLALLGGLGGLVVLWYSGLGIIRGTFTIGSYIAFSGYIGKLYGPTQIFANIGLSLQPATVALARIAELMDMSGEEERENGIKVKSINRQIEFKNVFFSYDTNQVLADINLKIKKGEKVLLAGPNGSGKSTIIKLLFGLYEVKKGLVLIDNQNINNISISSLRDRISIVSQSTFLFNDSIRNNILYSRPEATEEEIEDAIRLSGAHDFIKNLERGLDTGVGERGVRISGGERQKISIARAILKDSDVIVFDEATAHLDKKSENRINQLIKTEFRDKTCIIISHKISDVSKIDKVYFISKGKIAKHKSGGHVEAPTSRA